MAKISDHPTLGTRDDASYLEVVSSGVNKKQTPAVLLAGYATETYADTAASSAQSAAQTYTDGKVAGLSWKQAVRAATTANGTLATAFENGDSIDGVTLATGDRILIKNQSSASENGIYTVNASGAPTRATDADAGSELVNATVYVSEGSTQADTQWTCTTNAPITINSTSLAFAQLSTGSGTVTSVDASGGVQTVAGSAITTTGTIRGAHVINTQTGPTYAIVSGDRGKHLTLSNASPIAVSIAQAGTTGFEDGYFTVIENIGVGPATITPTTSTVNGASTLILNGGMSAVLFSDGTNYRAILFDPSGVSVNVQTGTSYTYLSGDRGKLVTHSNGSAIAGTLSQATGAWGAGWFMWVENRGAGTLTITPTTSTIDGAATLALTTNQGCLIVSDGTNYYTMRGIGASGAITSSGLTMSTARLLGRTTASTGAIEEISVGTGLTLSAGTLSASTGSSKYRKVFKPADNQAPSSNFMTLDTRNGHPVLNADATTQETAIFADVISSAYAGGDITVTVLACLASATSGTIGWDATFERVGTGQDIDSDGFATAQTITATTVPGTSGQLIALSVSITAGAAGTDSLAAGEAYRLRIRRDVANDTATGDGQIWAVVVSEN